MERRTIVRLARSYLSLFCACLLAIASLACAERPRRFLHAGGRVAPPLSRTGANLININVATAEELEKLPGIGRGLAARIVAHRNEYGRFRRTEHVMMVRGISARRYQAMRPLITAE
jgi:competence protein ComEA